MERWAELKRELDAWQIAGKSATLWLRDDDAALVMPELRQLLALSESLAVPLCLAVVPMTTSSALALEVERHPGIAVTMHGYRHHNHEAVGAKKAEFGEVRPLPEMASELSQGLAHMHHIFGRMLRPVLVPPWNRISADLVAALPAIGFRGLSAFGARPTAHPADGLTQVNSHVEVIDWKAGGIAAAPRTIIAGLTAHLRARRLRHAEETEATGLLTHHKIMKEKDFAALQAILAAVSTHPAARWLTLDEVFSAP
jgi:predicted deacetylase